MKNKFIIAIPAALILALSSVYTASASAVTAVPEPVNASTSGMNIPEENEGKYKMYTGTIEDIREHENRVTILVKSVQASESNETYFHIYGTTVLLDAETQEHTTTDKLKIGQEVVAAYSANTPVAMSFPPQINPEVIIIKEAGAIGSVKVDRFDESFLSSDGALKLNVSDETAIITVDGETLSKNALSEVISDRTLVVFYTITTRSLPPQTPPAKIIVLNAVATTTPVPENETVETKEPFYGEDYYEHNGQIMIPLAKAGAEYGYEVSWDDETRTVTLTNQTSTYHITIGQEAYKQNDNEKQLSTAPRIYNDRSYVPEEFLDEITAITL